MEQVPKISVVMSVYNGSNFLAQSIQAILEQTFRDFEFIIIDDASTDNTPDIIKKFADQDLRIRTFRNEKTLVRPASSGISIRVAKKPKENILQE
jgi:glycosyltransferase involved in cell wall biosynthesis